MTRVLILIIHRTLALFKQVLNIAIKRFYVISKHFWSYCIKSENIWNTFLVALHTFVMNFFAHSRSFVRSVCKLILHRLMIKKTPEDILFHQTKNIVDPVHFKLYYAAEILNINWVGIIKNGITLNDLFIIEWNEKHYILLNK